ncbi:MAG: nucleoside triphosphate pyrophosphohydrolase [Nitrospirota bacterium]|nr:nucleoside triphosphate pyrophosphohydrolase [Nitrospirota bacterium]MDH5768384.1 nucleoside triphosphate pyrophosphohydrolase [Nitrospirota bacterium]
MNFQELLNIMEKLRSKKGCPWDKEQTRESLKPFIIEEAYELIEAIEEGDPEKIKEELGDLMFQIVFQCQIAKEKNEFEMSDVIRNITKKMIARHPHVFGRANYKTTDEVLLHWEEQKKREGKIRTSILEGVPETLPSLLRAHRLQNRAAQVGFDWDKVEEVVQKLDEEIKEFKNAVNTKKRDEIEDELGDILFMIVNISRFTGVNPEDALRKTISKFISRFRYIERTSANQGRNLSDMTLKEMDVLWDEAKDKDNKG